VFLDRRRGVVCVVTDRVRLRPHATATEQLAALAAQARAAARAGADLLHLRERDLPDRDLLALLREIVEAVAGHGLRVLVNDRADIAMAAAADGVHLRADSIGAAAVRRLAPGMIVGQSAHARAEAGAAAAAGADFVVLGTLFPTLSKPHGHPTLGLETLRAIAADLTVPVLAIGGVNQTNIEAVARAGAAGVAAIGWFATTDAGQMQSAVLAARQPFDTPGALI
jgi:thiamine-phosphate pyrophosphorylase